MNLKVPKPTQKHEMPAGTNTFMYPMSNHPPSMNMFPETGPITLGEIFPDEQGFLRFKNQVDFAPHARVKLLIDTGSNISGVDRKIVQGLQLTPYDGNSEVNGVGGIHSLQRYRCVLFLKIFGMKGLPIDIIEGDYSQSPYDGIIGRDVLQYCSFSYHGPSNSFSLQAENF